jgi:glycosyltransferase involved in cell wall biosynthesis
MTADLTVSFVAPAAYPLGGVATWLDRIVPDLRQQGVNARVILAAGHHHDADAYLHAHPAIAPAMQVRSATGTRESRIQALATLLATTLEVHPRHVVISVNIPDVILAIARLRACGGAAGVRAVMSIHGLEPDLFADLASLAPLLDGVVCTNRLAQTRAAAIPRLDGGRVHYAPYGTPVSPQTDDTPDPVFTIGYAGRFERFQKRVQDLDPMASALLRRGVQARWLLAGDGPDRAQVEAMARNHPGRVELLGTVAPHRMQQDFYRRCHVLLNPSEWETGPITVWEAMANRLAVVSSRYTGSGREAALKNDVNCLLFDVGDVDTATACLQRMADPGLRERLAASAEALVRERYSPAASCAAWYRALVEMTSSMIASAPSSPCSTARAC